MAWADVYAEHRRYLGDAVKCSQFAAALEEVVRPGATVLDLGSGSGLLALLALRAGAAHVYAVESSSLIDVTRRVLASNDAADRVTCIRGHSTEITLPVRVDVVVADQLDGLVVDAGMPQVLDDAVARHLAPGGVVVPSAVEWWVAPVQLDPLRVELDFWLEDHHGLHVAPFHDLDTNAPRRTFVSGDAVVGSAVGPLRIDVGATRLPQMIDGTTQATRRARIDGLVGWFRATLSPGVVVTNEPGAAAALDRAHAVLPLAQPVTVGVGDAVDIRVRATSASHLAWEIGDSPRQHTVLGGPVSREDLRRSDPRSTPRLTPRGSWTRSILARCDGASSRADIETSAGIAPPAGAQVPSLDELLDLFTTT